MAENSTKVIIMSDSFMENEMDNDNKNDDIFEGIQMELKQSKQKIQELLYWKENIGEQAIMKLQMKNEEINTINDELNYIKQINMDLKDEIKHLKELSNNVNAVQDCMDKDNEYEQMLLKQKSEFETKYNELNIKYINETKIVIQLGNQINVLENEVNKLRNDNKGLNEVKIELENENEELRAEFDRMENEYENRINELKANTALNQGLSVSLFKVYICIIDKNRMIFLRKIILLTN